MNSRTNTEKYIRNDTFPSILRALAQSKWSTISTEDIQRVMDRLQFELWDREINNEKGAFNCD